MKNFSFRRSQAIARKEMFHILRDPYTLSLLLGMPILMVTIYGFAIDLNPKNLPLAVSDQDKTQSSRRLIETFSSSKYFHVHYEKSDQEGLLSVTNETAKATLIIPPQFERNLTLNRGGKAQILLDGSDSTTVGPVSSYANSILKMANQRIASFEENRPFTLHTRFLFNPELKSRWFVVPGLIVVVMSILSILLTALTVAREWENGSMELILSTPVQPSEIILGKLAPYGGFCLFAVILVFLISRFIFGVPFVGNILVFGLGLLIFLVTYLAQGLLISVISRSQVMAMQFSMLTGYLPTQLLSGFIFPIASMPLFFRYFTMIFPARWFMEISRDSFLKGSSLEELAMPFLALTITCLLMIRTAAKKFKRDLEK